MSHCISVYLIKESDLRGQKVDNIIDNKENNLKFTKLKAGILAITYIPNIKEFGKDKMVAKIDTDYFGGMGEQSAKLYDCNKKIYDQSDEHSYKIAPINDVLKLMGIVAKNGDDEFDTIGLGRYRRNEDFDDVKNERIANIGE